jgi:hypothetical protein
LRCPLELRFVEGLVVFTIPPAALAGSASSEARYRL